MFPSAAELPTIVAQKPVSHAFRVDFALRSLVVAAHTPHALQSIRLVEVLPTAVLLR